MPSEPMLEIGAAALFLAAWLWEVFGDHRRGLWWSITGRPLVEPPHAE